MQKESLVNGQPVKEYTNFYCKNIKQMLESEARSNTTKIHSLSIKLIHILEVAM
jgi:hypothetical protein